MSDLPEGRPIQTRSCRGSWWPANPRLLADHPKFVFEPFLKPLRHAVNDGEVTYLKALAGPMALAKT